MERTGGTDRIADATVSTATTLPLTAVPGLMYVVTATLTNVISNTASVVLMTPAAVTTLQSFGANAFAFALAVTFFAVVTTLGIASLWGL